MRKLIILLMLCSIAAKTPDVRIAKVDIELRACAGLDCEILLVIPANEQMTGDRVLGVADGFVWRRVIYKGYVGWVDSRQIERYYPPVQWGRYA